MSDTEKNTYDEIDETAEALQTPSDESAASQDEQYDESQASAEDGFAVECEPDNDDGSEAYEAHESVNADAEQYDDADEGIADANSKPGSFLASLLLKLGSTEQKKLNKMLAILISAVLLAVLIFTDIIPVLPNSYHRGYVGNNYTLGETQNCDYDKLGENMLYVGGGALCIFGPDMELEYRREIHTGIPVAKINSDNAVVYFKNTGEYIIVNKGNVSEHSVEERIISAYISSDGYYSIVTDAVAGHNACVTAYSPDGKFIYEWFTNYDVIDSAVAFSGTHMVASVVEVTDTGVAGKLVFFDLTKSEPVKEIPAEDNIIFELYSTESGKVICISENRTEAYTFDGHEVWQIDYTDQNLKTYDISDDGNIAFVFDRYSSAMSESMLEIYDFNGSLKGSYESEKNVRYVSANNDYCLLSLEDGTVLLNNKCRIKKVKELNMNFDKVILFDNYNFGFTIHDGISEIISVRH